MVSSLVRVYLSVVSYSYTLQEEIISLQSEVFANTNAFFFQCTCVHELINIPRCSECVVMKI